MQSFKLVSHGRREISEQVGFYTLLVLIILSSSACENHTRLKSGDSVMESSTQFAPNTQVAPQPVTQPHKSRRISDITGENDLVKLSSKWWGQSLDQFPSFVGLTSADYAVTDSPGSRGDKVILPNPEISAAKWSPSELKVFNFTFAASSGLRLS